MLLARVGECQNQTALHMTHMHQLLVEEEFLQRLLIRYTLQYA